MILIEGGVGAASEVHRLEETGATAPLRLEGEKDVMNASYDGFVHPRC